MKRNGELRGDETAVSEVISVVLMVAVAVILASVIAVFVFDLGRNSTTPAPAASFTYSQDSCGGIRITHDSGQRIDGDSLYFSGAAIEYTSPGTIQGWTGTHVTTGDSTIVGATPGETLRLNWVSDSGRSSAILSEYDVPSTATLPATASISGLRANTGVNDYVEATLSFEHASSVFVVVNTDGNGGEVTTTVSADGAYVFSYDGSGPGGAGVTKIDLSSQASGGKNVDSQSSVTVSESSARSCELAASAT